MIGMALISVISDADRVSGMEGYIGEWVGFMQMLPKYKRNDGYSLTAKCVSIALGDKKMS